MPISLKLIKGMNIIISFKKKFQALELYSLYVSLQNY